jgi:hypothetical protein
MPDLTPIFQFSGQPPQPWEVRAQNKKAVTITRNCFICLLLNSVVGRAGFEPATNGLKVRCSTS